MRIPKILFIIGLIMIIVGVLLVFVIPAGVTWEPKSEVLAKEEPLTISAGWQSKSESLIDKVITVSRYETYDYSWSHKPWIHEEAKDFVIGGTAMEQSSPQQQFNFYVFDDVNFDLWKAGKAYTTYYEAKGKTSVSFTFSIATEDDIPDIFVVEEYAEGVKPTVRVTTTVDWVEKASLYDCSDYFTSWEFTFEEAKDFRLTGTATEEGNHKFNFYIFDSDNYWNWKEGKSYTSYYEIKNVRTTSFYIPLTEDEATSTIHFVAENPLLDVNETVRVSATLEWKEKATIAATIVGLVLGSFVGFIGFILIIIAGIATLVFKPKAQSSSMP